MRGPKWTFLRRKWRDHLRIPFIVERGSVRWRGALIGRDAMTERTEREARKGDFSQHARQIVQAATAERDEAMLKADDAAYAKKLSEDPVTQVWLEAAQGRLDEGAFDEDVDAQPDPRTAAEQFKAQRRQAGSSS